MIIFKMAVMWNVKKKRGKNRYEIKQRRNRDIAFCNCLFARGVINNYIISQTKKKINKNCGQKICPHTKIRFHV